MTDILRLPCNFCGSSDIQMSASLYKKGRGMCWYIECRDCCARGPSQHFDRYLEDHEKEKNCLDAWNDRR